MTPYDAEFSSACKDARERGVSETAILRARFLIETAPDFVELLMAETEDQRNNGRT